MSATNMTLGSTLLSIQQQVTRYLYSSYLIFGITGCCLNILLLSRQKFRNLSCCTYFLVASMTMIISLSVAMGLSLYALNHVDPVVTISACCKMRVYVSQSSSMMYRWCLTMACLDRFALSSANARLRNFATVRVARRVIAVIVLIWLVLPVHTLIFYNLKGGGCGIFDSYAEALYHSLFTTITGSILPVSIMIICAFLIHRNLVHKRQRRQQNVIPPSGRINGISDTQQKRDQQVLVMLLVQALVYVVLIIPLMGFYFYNAVSLGIPNKSTDRVAIERFAQYISETIINLFPVSSFYLYTLVSSTFRHELVKILCSAIKCKYLGDNNRIAPMLDGSTCERSKQRTMKMVPQSLARGQNTMRQPTDLDQSVTK